jgi:hypothetical protein
MKILIFVCLFFFSSLALKAQGIKLTNGVLVGQLDRSEDKFTAEINLAEIFAECGVNVIPSLNLLKQGAPLSVLVSDSVKSILTEKKIDTYILVNVRGYDRQFRLSTKIGTLEEELIIGHLFPLFRDEITSITFEFNFFRDGKLVHTELMRLKNVSSKEKLIQKLHKKLPKRINHWKL